MDTNLSKARDTAADSLSIGRSSRKRGDHDAALAFFIEASEGAPHDLHAAIEVAATLGHLQRYEDAEAHFRAILVRAPRSSAALAGLGDLMLRRGESALALDWFERAALLEPRNLVRIQQIARTLKLLGRLDEAEARFRYVLEREPGHIGTLIHLGEIARQRGDLPAALDFFAQCLARDPSRRNVHTIMATMLRQLGQLPAAEACYHAILAQQPGHVGSLIALAEIARARGDFSAALDWLLQAAAVAPPGLALQNMLAGALRDVDRLDEAEAAYRAILMDAPGNPHAVTALGILEMRRQNPAAALPLFTDAAAKTPESAEAWFRVADCLGRLARFEDAADILLRLEGMANVDKAELQVRRFDHLCMTMQLNEAEAFLDVWGGAHHVPDHAVVRTAQLLVAQKRWSAMLAFFDARVLGGGFMGQHYRLMEPLARAARATGRYAEAYDMLGSLPGGDAIEAVRQARDQLLEEMRLVQHVRPGRLDPALPCDGAISDPFRAQRAALLASVLSGHPAGAQDLHIYTCADATYLAGASVCLFSLLKHNELPRHSFRFSVFCNDDVLDLATEVFGAIACAFAARIDVRAASRLVPSALDLRVGWGNFTPGRTLSEAAYYRIYAARALIAEGAGSRALYIDSDTCVFSGIAQLRDVDLAGQPLAARVDDGSKASIQRAIRLLGLEQDSYFNSGVLLFDLDHPDLPGLLDRSIEVALTKQHLLTHVDQCALNVAFQRKFAVLPERFNSFVTAETPVAETQAGGRHADQVISHFIAHPKPWDTMYPTANCMPWISAFADLGQVVPPYLLKRLLALHYPTAAAD